MQNIGIYWFSNDLRVDDNPGLQAIADDVDTLLCVYILEPEVTSQNRLAQCPKGENAKGFLHESLRALDAKLTQLGHTLWVFDGPSDVIMPHIIGQIQATHVYRSVHAGFYEATRWQHIKLQKPWVEFKAFHSHTLFEKATLPFNLDDLPASFSKFRNQVEKHLVPEPPCDDVTLLPPPVAWQGDSVPLDASQNEHALVKGGEDAAIAHVKAYFKGDHALSYKDTRNALDGMHESTKFSPYLALGCISARRIYHTLKDFEAQREANESTYWIYFELLWREYFQWYAHSYDNKLFLFSGIKNSKPLTSFYPNRFRAWCQGETPYPIVNACMRQLNQTGYMSNRGRQLVASALVHELSCDWRYGAAYFEQHLIDYDVASNWGNWQYLAGVGADPRGHRQFNLAKQTQMYDPEGRFIARFQGDTHCAPLNDTSMVDWPEDE